MSTAYYYLQKIGDDEWAKNAEDVLHHLLWHFDTDIRHAWRIASKHMMKDNSFIKSRLELTVLLGEVFLAYQGTYVDNVSDSLDEIEPHATVLRTLLASPVNQGRLLEYMREKMEWNKFICTNKREINIEQLRETLSSLSTIATKAHKKFRKHGEGRVDHIRTAVFRIAEYWATRWKQEFKQYFVSDKKLLHPSNNASQFCCDLIMFVERLMAYCGGSRERLLEYRRSPMKAKRIDREIAGNVKSAMIKFIQVRRASL